MLFPDLDESYLYLAFKKHMFSNFNEFYKLFSRQDFYTRPPPLKGWGRGGGRGVEETFFLPMVITLLNIFNQVL